MAIVLDTSALVELERSLHPQERPASLPQEPVVISAELSRTGSLIPQNDIAVAATCRSLGCGVPVGPNDEELFRRVPALDVHVISAEPPDRG